MIYELVFTSYHKGLKSGTSGFTTVAHTTSMPRNYVILCESLSGYQYTYSLSHPLYNQNPIAYSHYIFKSGNQNISILSKVCAFDKDYTGRENKLAHHILLHSDERNPGGPARVMDQGNLFFDKWHMDPHHLEPGRIQMPVEEEKENYETQTWKKTFGDAGAAGVLARSALETPNIPAFIIFEPGMPMLPLIEEALCLIPPEKRWQITFNTYFTVKPIDADCQWRCCLPDSAPLATGARYPGALIVDIPNRKISRELSEKDKLIICARDGSAPPWAVKKSNRTDAATSDPFALYDIKKPHIPDNSSPKHLIQKPKKRNEARRKKILIRTGFLISALILIFFLLLLFRDQISGLSHLQDKTNTYVNVQSLKSKSVLKNKIKETISELPMDAPKISPETISPNKNEPSPKAMERSENEINGDNNEMININDVPQAIKFEAHSSEGQLALGKNINDLESLKGYVFNTKGKAAVFVIGRNGEFTEGIAEINLSEGKIFGTIYGEKRYDKNDNESLDQLTLKLNNYLYSEADKIALGNSDYPYAAVYFRQPALVVWISPVVLNSKMIKFSGKHLFYIDLTPKNQNNLSKIIFNVPLNHLKGSIYYKKGDDSFPFECSKMNKSQLFFDFPDNGGHLNVVRSDLDKKLNTLRENENALIEIKENKNLIDYLTDENLQEKLTQSNGLKSLEDDINDINEYIEAYNKLKENKNQNNDLTDESVSSLKTEGKEIARRIVEKAEPLLKKISNEIVVIEEKHAEIKALLNFLNEPGSVFPEKMFTLVIEYHDDKDSSSQPRLFISE